MAILTLRQWREKLSPTSLETFEDWSSAMDAHKFSSSEILEEIVRYRGGIASATELTILIKEVFDIDLREDKGV